MTARGRIVLSSDHAAIPVRQAIGARVVAEGLALDSVDAFQAADFEGGRTRRGRR